jgi:hypothetical protein
VTDATADLTHAVLMKVGDFIRKLPADQLADLASGEAKLELVPKGGRPATTRRAAPKPPAVSTDEVRAALQVSADTQAATRYLDSLKFTVDQLRALGAELGVPLPSKATKAKVLDAIVEDIVGRRLDSEAINRPAPARF